MRLEEKVIIITGASSGIGKAAAHRFAREGAKLVLGARREDALGEVANSIRDAGGVAEYVAGDVSSEAYAGQLVDFTIEKFGRLDGAFNNAGTTGVQKPVVELTLEDWNDVISTNLTSGFFAARKQVPAMIESGGGSIVFTSSFVGSTIGLPGMGAYAASKSGLIGMTQVLAVEYGQQNVRVNALLPGGTLTEMAGDDPVFHKTVAGLHALKRMASAEEIANGALFLLSDEGSFATGSSMFIDGGNSINKF